MLLEDIELKIAKIRAKPLKILCRRPDGITTVMSVPQCVKSGSAYICIVEDELDGLLANYLEERKRNHDYL